MLEPPQCFDCIHPTSDGVGLDEDGLSSGSCKAFPDGIPFAIWDNTFDHRNPWPGDGGIRFEAIPVSGD